MKALSLRHLVLLFSLWAAVLGTAPNTQAADVIISEFMAANGATITDENGDASDWIELHNVTTNTINLQNWSLTDAAGNLFKWRLPATNLGPNRIMVVWASGKDRRDPGQPLHTSFRLPANGGYLALVRPDSSIASQFTFDSQFRDVSYGYPMLVTNYTAVAANGPARILVPTNGNLGTNWVNTDFDDSTWQQVTNGIGYDAGGAGSSLGYAPTVMGKSPAQYYRLNDTSGNVAASLTGAANNGTYAGGFGLNAVGPRPPTYAGIEDNNTAVQLDGSTATISTPALNLNSANFTVTAWVRKNGTPVGWAGIFFSRGSSASGLNFGTAGEFRYHWNDSATSYNWNSGLTAPDGQWTFVALVVEPSKATLYMSTPSGLVSNVNAVAHGSQAFSGVAYIGQDPTGGRFFNGQVDEVAVWRQSLTPTDINDIYRAAQLPTSFGGMVRTDVRTSMQNISPSLYARHTFTMEDPKAVERMVLRLRFDDGFTAFLNGQAVAFENAPDPETLAFNSTAAGDRPKSDAFGWKYYDLLDHLPLLRTGTNVLAIQGLNDTTNGSDFLLESELTYITAGNYEPLPRYFQTATPGELNGAGSKDLGPIFGTTSFSPEPQPQPGQSLTVTAAVSPSFQAVSNVLLYYRVMFNAQSVITMKDDGTDGDVLANDGTYSAIIPGATNGQMIRWYFLAQDVAGNQSRWPLFQDPTGSAEYLGTVVQDSNLVSKLPIIQLFVNGYANGAGVDSAAKTGGRASVFYDGELYDNIFMRVRGNSTTGLLKKSHRMTFNREHLFRHPGPGGKRLRNTSFTADYPDPTYMRQGVTFWLAEMFGAPGPFYHPVRLQMNGAFYQLANHNDVHGEEMLERLGFDPNGALYNAAGQVTPGKASTGGFDKKTRTWDNDNDYLDLANKIAETVPAATRRINALDLFDIPQALNYLVVARWVHENDDVWANMSLYHDNDGDGLWRIIPFDMNLSWGAIFAEGDASLYTGVQATNDNHKSHPLYGSSQTLALSGPASAYNRVYDTFFLVPQLREMYLRRLRTMMDTFIYPPGAPAGSTAFEQRVFALRDYMAEESVRDRALWNWPAVGGQNNFAPGKTIQVGVTEMLEQFLVPRRQHFYVKHSITNTALVIGTGKANNAGIPLTQPTNAVVEIVDWESNPATGNQDQEYVCLTNRNPFALDISGWKLGGGARFTFKPGTVMASNTAVYIARSIPGFRSRTNGPSFGKGLLVVGPFDGQLSAWGESITVRDPAGRLVSSNGYPANPSLAQQFLRVTELMYSPPVLLGDPTYREDYEYVELKNISTAETLDLNGVRLTDGIEFAFTGSAVTNLGPGQRVLVVKSRVAFTNRYGAGLAIAGEYQGYLNNGGETVRLVDKVGEKILQFTYNNAWYPTTDGLGPSLVVVDELAPWENWENASQWRPSTAERGSPGQGDLAPQSILPLYINEVLANSGTQAVDRVEIFNPHPTPAPIGGWFLSDDFNWPKKYQFAPGATVPANGYLVIDESEFNPMGLGFAFSSGGDEVYLFSGDTQGNLTGYFHGYSFGASPLGRTLGRHITVLGTEFFTLQATNSLGEPNGPPDVPDLVISEIMFRPPDIPEFDPIEFNPSIYPLVDNTQDEFIELFNRSGMAIPLATAGATNEWRVRGGVDFDFPAGAVMPANGYLLLVNFNPADTNQLASFRSKYNVAESVPIYGPYQGKLNNDKDTIRLQNYQELQYVDRDVVEYQDGLPWPCGADGTGNSLQRHFPGAFGNDPLNWAAKAPSAAAATVPQTPGQAVISAPPASVAAPQNGSTSLFVDVCSLFPVHYQWRFNGADLPGETNAILNLSNLQTNQTGLYSVVVSNAAGATETAPANLWVQLPPTILAEPQTQTVLAFSDPTLTVDVGPTPPFSYQWKYNGNYLATANSASLVLTNVQKSQAGQYQVIVWNAAGQVTSAVATLTVNVPAKVVGQPASLTATNGNTVTFAPTIAGDTPVTAQWYFNGNVLTNATNTTLTLTQVTNTHTGPYFVVVSNRFGMDTSAVANLTVYIRARFLVSPASDVVSLTEAIQASAVVEGTPPFRWVWLKGTAPFLTNYSTIPSNSMALPMTLLTDAAQYAVQVTNIATTGTGQRSSFAPITVVQPPHDREAVAGSNLTLRATVAAQGTVGYQWQHAGTNLPGATTTTLVLTNLTADAGGPYTLIVSNAVRTRAYPFTLAVRDTPAAPAIVESPAGTNVPTGAKALMRVLASGTEPLGYQWFRDETNLVAGGTNLYLPFTNVTAAHAGAYTVVVTNPVGAVTSAVALLNLQLPARIVESPTNTTVTAGQPAVLAMVGGGSEPLGYQWYFQGTNALPQGTGPVLTLPAAQAADAGAYLCVVSNAFGMATSAVAMLTVEAGLADTDHDGIPDDWEREHGLVVGTDDGLADPDRDGLNNRQEYLAGTDPQSAASVLKLATPPAAGGGLTLRFEAVANRPYTLEYLGRIGETNWLTLDTVPAAPSNRWIDLPQNLGTNATRYYRLGTPGPQ